MTMETEKQHVTARRGLRQQLIQLPHCVDEEECARCWQSREPVPTLFFHYITSKLYLSHSQEYVSSDIS